jgi:hypothetical protein
MFPRRTVGMVGDWCWCADHVCKFKYRCLDIFFCNACFVFAQICVLTKNVHLLYYLTTYVSKLPCGTHTNSNWKWIPKYADCDVAKRMSNYCLSVKHTQSSNYLGFEVLTAVSTKMAVFWVVAPCSLVDVYQCFRGPCCLNHQDKTLVNIYHTTTQKTAISVSIC